MLDYQYRVYHIFLGDEHPYFLDFTSYFGVNIRVHKGCRILFCRGLREDERGVSSTPEKTTILWYCSYFWWLKSSILQKQSFHQKSSHSHSCVRHFRISLGLQGGRVRTLADLVVLAVSFTKKPDITGWWCVELLARWPPAHFEGSAAQHVTQELKGRYIVLFSSTFQYLGNNMFKHKNLIQVARL